MILLCRSRSNILVWFDRPSLEYIFVWVKISLVVHGCFGAMGDRDDYFITTYSRTYAHFRAFPTNIADRVARQHNLDLVQPDSIDRVSLIYSTTKNLCL
jgi:hypothetical protein